MASFRYAASAIREVDAIAQSRANGESWLTSLEDILVKLANFPHMGRIRDDLMPEAYAFPFRDHNIFYDLEDGGIVVLHVRTPR
jgi:plasmid stabilization system protein ParE